MYGAAKAYAESRGIEFDAEKYKIKSEKEVTKCEKLNFKPRNK